jgi:hypothetical protein
MRTAKISDIDYITIGLDPVLLGALVGIELDPWQADVMRFSGRQLILNCHRQSAMSAVWLGSRPADPPVIAGQIAPTYEQLFGLSTGPPLEMTRHYSHGEAICHSCGYEYPAEAPGVVYCPGSKVPRSFVSRHASAGWPATAPRQASA